MSVNRLRGEVEVELFGGKHRLVPDHKTILAIEELSDYQVSVLTIFRSIAKESYPLKYIALVLCGAMQAAGVKYEVDAVAEGQKHPKPRPYTLDEVILEVRKRGISRFILALTNLVPAMVTPEEIEADEKKATPERSTG